MNRALRLAVLFALAACKQPCDPSTECPTPLSVRGQCMTERTCAIGKVMGWCVTGDCRLERGTTLTVPLDAVDISKLKTLFVDYRSHAPGAPDPTQIDAELDGVKGKAVAVASGGSSPAALVTWSPFPASPKTLMLRFDDGTSKTVDPNFQFEDAACETQDQVGCTAF